MPRSKKITEEPVESVDDSQAAVAAAPEVKKSKKVPPKTGEPAPAPKERKVAVRPTHTTESVKLEFADLVEKLREEIEKRKQDSGLGGVRFLQAVKKQIETIGKHTARISYKRPSNRKGNTNSGFLKPVTISKDMAQFAGWDASQPRSRVDATKALCHYIKENNLQNPENRRQIFPDQKLAKLLGYKEGSEPLTYYSMQTYMKSHFNSQPASEAGPAKKIVKSKGIKPKKTA